MTDIDRGENYRRAVEFVNKRAGGFSSPVDEARAYMGIAQIEAAHILADSQRLLAETIVEANRLKRIELGMAEPGDHALVGASREGFTTDGLAIARSWDRTPSAIEAPPAGGDVG